MFSHNGANGQNQSNDVMFGRVRQVAAQVGGRAERTGGKDSYPDCIV